METPSTINPGAPTKASSMWKIIKKDIAKKSEEKRYIHKKKKSLELRGTTLDKNRSTEQNGLISRQHMMRYTNFWSGIQLAIDKTPQGVHVQKQSKLKEMEQQEEALLKKLDKLYLLHPSNQRKFWWDIAVSFFTIVNCLYIPFALAFADSADDTFDAVYELFTVILYFCDMGLTFNTAIIEDVTGRLVVNRISIATNYMQFWFWLDVVSTFPFDLIYRASNPGDPETASFLELFRMVRFARLFKMTRFEKYLPTSKAFAIVLTLSQLLLVAHTVGCFWYYVGKRDVVKNPYGDPSTWIEAFLDKSMNTFDLYIVSVYWTMVTMMTIGYGDVHVVNTDERVFTIGVGMLGGVILGMILSNVTKLVESSNPQARAIEDKMSEFRAYLNEGNKVNDALKSKAIQAYNYYLQRKSDVHSSHAFDGLPPILLNKLIVCIFGSTIKRIIVFENIAAVAGQDFVVNLVMKSKPYQSHAGDCLSEFGDIADEMTFILRGAVQIWRTQSFDCVTESSNQKQVDKVIEGYATHGYYFGDFEFHMKSTRIANYYAYSECEFISISYSDIEELSNQFEDAGILFGSDVKARLKTYQLTSKSTIERLDSGAYMRSQVWKDGSDFSIAEVQEFLESEKHTAAKTYPVIRAFDKVGHFKVVPITEAEMLKSGFIHPNTTMKIVWDICMMILTVIVIFSSTTQVFFQREPEGPWFDFDIFLTIVFLLDVLLMFLTPYEHPDVSAFVLGHSLIAQDYIRRWFVIDVLSSLPYDQIFTSSGKSDVVVVKIIRMFRLLKLFRAVKLIHYFNVWKAKLNLDPTLVKMTVLLFQVVAANHFVACIWWYLCVNMTDVSWMDHDSMVYAATLRDANLFEQYIVTMYWSFITLLGIGYGDITPTNTAERAVCIFIILFGSSLFSYIMARVAEMFQMTNSSHARLMQRISTARGYLAEKSIPPAVGDSILNFVEAKSEQTSLFNETEFLSCLPDRINHELFLLHRSKILHMIPIFDYIPNKSITVYLFNMFTVAYYSEGEYIFNEGEPVNSVKFLVTGAASLHTKKKAANKRQDDESKVETIISRVNTFRQSATNVSSTSFFAKTSEKPLSVTESVDGDEDILLFTVNPGDFFGHNGIMKTRRYTNSLWTTESCSVYVLSKASLLKLLRDHPSAAFSLQAAFIEAIRVQQNDFRHRQKLTQRDMLFEDIDVKISIDNIKNKIPSPEKPTKHFTWTQKIRQLGRRRSSLLYQIVSTGKRVKRRRSIFEYDPSAKNVGRKIVFEHLVSHFDQVDNAGSASAAQQLIDIPKFISSPDIYDAALPKAEEGYIIFRNHSFPVLDRERLLDF